jgi:hypothetical protein
MVFDYSAPHSKQAFKELIPLKTRLFTYLAVAGCSMIVGAALLAQVQPAPEKPCGRPSLRNPLSLRSIRIKWSSASATTK